MPYVRTTSNMIAIQGFWKCPYKIPIAIHNFCKPPTCSASSNFKISIAINISNRRRTSCLVCSGWSCPFYIAGGVEASPDSIIGIFFDGRIIICHFIASTYNLQICIWFFSFLINAKICNCRR